MWSQEGFTFEKLVTKTVVQQQADFNRKKVECSSSKLVQNVKSEYLQEIDLQSESVVFSSSVV